ncbi:DUF1090 domain-containing protein [Moritella marina]|uniref:DUF1090 domain-containing protein n=1 Tax=Moritella marina TaxID=90736 RepID=UPI003703BD81
MKTNFKLALCVLLGISTNALASDCSALKACDKKICEINTQLSMAESAHNQHKVDGLNKALKYATQYCTTDGLRDDIKDKIEDSMEDIEDYKSDLKEAKSDNKMDKVEKYTRKIAQENDKISMLKLELADLE